MTVIAILATITFFMIRLAPGGPFSQEREFDPAVTQALNQRYHFDKPMVSQYLLYVRGVLSGDFGPSLKQKNRTVTEIISTHLPPSLLLGTLGLILAIAIGCKVDYASKLVYADDLDLTNESTTVPIGVNCRLCLRNDCIQRANPPMNRRVSVEENYRGTTPFTFEEF